MIFVLLILNKIINIFISYSDPLSRDLGSGSRRDWDGRSSINLIVKASDWSLLNFDPVEKKLTVLKIPDETFIELPKNLGNWKISSIFELGQSENPANGAKLLEDSLSRMFGLPVEGTLIINQEKQVEDIIRGFNKNFLNSFLSLDKMESDLTKKELVNLMLQISGTRSDKIVFLDLGSSEITESILLGDSSRVLGIDTIKLDLFIRDKMTDDLIFNEEKTVAVFNSTDHPGLANEATRMITNLGGNVIITSNSAQNLDESVIFEEGQTSETFIRLSQIFAPECLSKACQISDPKVNSSRADIKIIIGEDFYQRYY